jgi:hypothetical protein
MAMVTGPFTMAAGDSQELVVALMAGLGADRLSSVTNLRSVADLVQQDYRKSLVSTGVPNAGASDGSAREFSLSQNYPNPFNPTTTIQFTLVDRQSTIVRVYDILGREVATLVNEMKFPGSYTIRFDGSKLASGTYFYRLQAGSYTQTRKLLLLR